MPLLAILAICLLTGMLLAAQPAINAELSRHLASGFAAAFVSLTVSAVLALPFAWRNAEALRPGALAAAPAWVWLGGVAGAVFVTAGAFFVPRIGVAFFFSSIIAGQLIAAAVIDHYGLLGASVRAFDLPRAIGIVLVLAGVLVFRLTRG